MGDSRKRDKSRRIHSPIKRKVLLLLQAGLALGLAGTFGKQIRVAKGIAREWDDIDRQYLHRIVREFYHDRLVRLEEHPDGTCTVVLTEKGKRRALTFNLDMITIPRQETWDGVWRVVVFDIPETHKQGRNALREKLRELGFFPWQKSVFVHPYPCRDQVDFVVECFELRPYVRYATLSDVTNDAELKLRFGLK